MSLSLDRLRYLLRKGLGKLNDDKFGDTDADELLNLSLWELEGRFEYEKKFTSIYTTLVEDQFEYSISASDLGLTLDTIESISVEDSEGVRHKLSRLTRGWLDENFSEDETGRPTKYLRENDVLTVYPVPSEDEDGLRLHIVLTEGIDSLLDGSVETTGLPRNWDELVLQGAIWRGKYFDQDVEKALLLSNFQRSKITEIKTDEMKRDEDSRYAGLQVMWEEPE